jgi:hypothetical protein
MPRAIPKVVLKADQPSAVRRPWMLGPSHPSPWRILSHWATSMRIGARNQFPPGISATEFSSGGWTAMDDWPTSVNDTNGARSSPKLSGGYPASQETRTGFHCRPPAWKRQHGTAPENGLTTPGIWLVAPLHRRLYHLLERSDVVRKFSTVSVTSMIGDSSSLEGAKPGNKTGHGQQSAADLPGAPPGFDSFRRAPFIGVLGENSAQQDSNRETHHVLTT